MTIHPMHSAKYLAACLECDPVAAGQIKEHVKPERLCELLGLTSPERLSNMVELQLIQCGADANDRAFVRDVLGI